MTMVTWRREGATGFVTLANPPVNAIGLSVREGLLAAVSWAHAESGLERVVLTGGDKVFAAGGDAREFDAAPVAPHLPDVCAAIEACPVPWVAAAHGAALGGGAELMMACRYRIGAPSLQFGLPEVTLGVVPGAGGTQRTPRLAGMAKALDLVTSGKPLSVHDALEAGLIDAMADDPVEAATRVSRATLDAIIPVSQRPAPALDEAAIAKAREAVVTRMRGQVAPAKAIELVAMSANVPFAEAMLTEREAFVGLRNQPQAKALRHIFFAERGAKAPTWLTAEPKPVTKAIVVGGGTMGAGIAYAFLSAGIEVVLVETDEAGIERARTNVESIVGQGLKRGLLDDAAAAALRARLTLTTDPAVGADAGLAIEAAFESMEVKKQVFARLEAALGPDAILATNTSYLDIDAMAEGLADPSRLVGLHFFAPAHIMKLLEIVRGAKTSDTALATGFALARRLKKIPVLSGVCDGFIGNRILARYREAADTLLMDGSTPPEIDEAMVAFGYAMGPYEAQDLSGLDIAFANRRRQDATRDPRRRYIPIADRMVELGKLGKKTGAGWYRYPGGNGKVEDPIVADLCIEEAWFAKVTRRDIPADEIRHRLVLAMINEAADILAEGIAQSATDIDLVTVAGYGFPRWRGGLMHHADTIGAAAILEGLRELEREDPIAWKPSAAVVACAETGTPFAQFRRET